MPSPNTQGRRRRSSAQMGSQGTQAAAGVAAMPLRVAARFWFYQPGQFGLNRRIFFSAVDGQHQGGEPGLMHS